MPLVVITITDYINDWEGVKLAIGDESEDLPVMLCLQGSSRGF